MAAPFGGVDGRNGWNAGGRGSREARSGGHPVMAVHDLRGEAFDVSGGRLGEGIVKVGDPFDEVARLEGIGRLGASRTTRTPSTVLLIGASGCSWVITITSWPAATWATVRACTCRPSPP